MVVAISDYKGWVLGVGRRFDGKWLGWILDEGANLVRYVNPDLIQPNSEVAAKAAIAATASSLRNGARLDGLCWRDSGAARWPAA